MTALTHTRMLSVRDWGVLWVIWVLVSCQVLYNGSQRQVGCVVEAVTPDAPNNSPPNISSSEQRNKILILDVDNTLYDESLAGIERQIVSNTHAFCGTFASLTAEQADELYHKYGSTVEGLRHSHPELLAQFYHDVYQPIDVCSGLLSSSPDNAASFTTGYTHQTKRRKLLLQQLLSLHHKDNVQIYLASNSPLSHVSKVVSALGLRHIPYKGILTPDTVFTYPNLPFPTKSHASLFYKSLFEKHDKQDLILLEDSLYNLQQAKALDMTGYHVTSHHTLPLVLGTLFGHILPISDGKEKYQFSDVDYLKAKNVVDAESIDEAVWNQMQHELLSSLPKDGKEPVVIVDVGAGRLSMLELLLRGTSRLSPLVLGYTTKEIHYYAYEPNQNLIPSCHDTLQKLGFHQKKSQEEEEMVFVGENGDTTVTVHLRMRDFTADLQRDSTFVSAPHLIVGCCFADLWDPNQLVASLLPWMMMDQQSQPLIYFPITFSGTTFLDPPKGFECDKEIPSDTLAMQLYGKSLVEQQGHNIDPFQIIETMQQHGAQLLTHGKSNWNIDATHQAYLWQTMLYFLGTTAAPELTSRGWNAQQWVARIRSRQPTIRVSNVDLLFRFTPILDVPKNTATNNIYTTTSKNEAVTATKVTEIQFVAPRQVTTVTKQINEQLGPNQIRVKSVCSLISSGTELKIFKGEFDDAAALDVNIKGMADESMSYPLAYGYSLVGIVTECGSDVQDAKALLGRLVFTFSPHSTHVICERDAIHLVPHGISAEDAIFMPSVETALSIVHDAHVRVGERIAVYGQGLIGLLVTAILSRHHNTDIASRPPSSSKHLFGTITTFDTIADRLLVSSQMGTTEALLPSEAKHAGPFDVSIEVSGNSRALQSAIDHTENGGRIIVASWYGNASVELQLGIDFHRSHVSIQTSQVSDIPAQLRGLWSKPRRFALTWDLLQQIRPSQQLLTKVTHLKDAQAAYELLERGKEIAVAFKYNNDDDDDPNI
mmetsp:Transcript_29466/g.53990  ORF Transcript_29466/g.53990 Transcript_29466/m.53990 type:complete len:993 (-) Transcript_29466:359-3337(-)|eukprot:CAMPEP_0198288094 /NCGR_PEP_ID=MMETSP1449-20131203/6707_1 /TAXON_ID=420275 /ORGANISM="Attheya septentrionalis, Strain CCMP2084" /LENGTH=992 /DNA_ID=CAMNT_0043986189 /DNA_START=8 /DNA_END=2989 /DNA_ORIENTATION=-